MCELHDFLPSLIICAGDFTRAVDSLYLVFNQDFKLNAAFHFGIRVIFNREIKADGQGKEEFFWKIISRDDYKAGERLIDFRRAERLPWAKPLMQSGPRPEILVWDYQEGSAGKRVRTYIWVKDHDYVVVLERKARVYFWVTAFFVPSDGKREDLTGRYKKRLT